MLMIKLEPDQRGFSAGSAVVLILLLTAVFMSARFVMRAADDSGRQGGKISEVIHGGEEPNDPSDDDYIPDSPGSGGVEMQIRRVEVEIQVLNVFLTASLPAVYTGTCYAEVSLPDGSEARRYTEPLDRTNKCRIAIPRGKLEAGKTWQFQMSFHSKDGKYYGKHPQETFVLP